MKISTPSHLLLAASTFLATSTNIRRAHAEAWNNPDTRLDDVAVKKDGKDVAVPFESVTTKSNDAAALTTSVHKDPSHAVSFEDAMKPTTSKSGLPLSGGKADSGDLDVFVPDTDPTQQKIHPEDPSYRSTYGPHRYDPDQDSLEDFILRVLQGDSRDGSPFACIADGTSCTGQNSCEDSPYLHVEPFACSGPNSCSQSMRIMVGMESCTGGGSSEFHSCYKSPYACIGQQSCFGNSYYGACEYSEGIFVSDHSCTRSTACTSSRHATIRLASCNGTGACANAPNIMVEMFSCGGRWACRFSEGAKIGRYSCNCDFCCVNLEPFCAIPDFRCNGDGPEDDCSFGNEKGCPIF